MYDLEFLNKYFSTKEFNFINNANSETKEIEDLIATELNKRDMIIDLINNLNSFMATTSDATTLSEISSILSEVQQIFQKINENVSALQNCKKLSSKISDDIVNLLIDVESHPNNISEYNDKIRALKDSLNNFSLISEQTKSDIFLSNLRIDICIKKDVVQKYLLKFNINYNLENTVNNTINNPTTPKSFIEIDVPNKLSDNNVLLISEKRNKVFLPYTHKEILLYLEQYPNEYKSEKDVISKEFEAPLDYFMKHPVIARFRETYSLIRDRESKSALDAFKYGIDLMFHYELNPAIIAACKTQQQLENYLECQSKNKLNDFTDFKIKFEVAPNVSHSKKATLKN